MKITLHCVALLMIAALISAVPVSAATTITNDVSAEANSGGNQGGSISTGEERSQVKIHTTVNGETITNIEETSTSGALRIEASNVVGEATTSSDVTIDFDMNSDVSATTVAVYRNLVGLLAQLLALFSGFSN